MYIHIGIHLYRTFAGDCERTRFRQAFEEKLNIR